MKEGFVSLDPTEFVNHAHDEYLDILIEAGLPGVSLIVVFVAWLLKTSIRLVGDKKTDSYPYAGAVASWAILIHSMVDYPLRTSAIAAMLAMSLAMVVSKPSQQFSKDNVRGLRHVQLG